MEERNYCVYKHTSPSGKVYIGITKQEIDRRWQSGRGYKNHPYFWNAIQKYGWENITHEVLFSSLTRSEAQSKERELIKQYNSCNPMFGYNMTFGGESGTHFTDEVKEKISQRMIEYYKSEDARKRRSDYQTGKKHSEETKAKMSESHKARMTDELRRKISESQKGRTYPNRKGHAQTNETKKRISEKKKGKHQGGRGRKPKPVICVETQELFESAVDVQKKKGYAFSDIYRCCNGERKKAYGFTWRYAV